MKALHSPKFLNVSHKYYVTYTEDDMGRASGTYKGKKIILRTLVVKLLGKRPLGRQRSKWQDNIKWLLKK